MIHRVTNSPLMGPPEDGSEPVSGHLDSPISLPPVRVEPFDPRAGLTGDAGAPPPEIPLVLPHTFHVTGQRASPGLNTIVCDGSGDIDVRVRPGTSACIRECVVEHEYQNRQDVLERDPKVCAGQPEGALVLAHPLAADAVELRGYDIELRCLQDELKKAKAECRPIVQDRIQTVKHEIQKRTH